MKKAIILFVVICAAFQLNAATNITTPTVSGHWTLAGSPYRVYNNISIPSGQSLIVDPGVSIIFQGIFSCGVAGDLQANGTALSPILFDVQDTTGWHIDTVGATVGGWRGMHIFSSSGDTSSLTFCNFHHLKNGSITVLSDIKAEECTFSENIGAIFDMESTLTSGLFEIKKCTFSNNYVTSGSLIKVASTSSTSEWYIHENLLFNNVVGRMGSILNCTNSRLLFFRNSIHHNTVDINAPGLLPSEDIRIMEFWSVLSMPCYAVLIENSIYENTSIYSAPIYCQYANVDFYRNYICNNRHLDTAYCAHAFGGGGLYLVGNGDFGNVFYPSPHSVYTVRNNIIANNYSALYGGGISIFNAQTLIANNTIVNNRAPRGGAIDMWMIDTVTTCIRNNIFWGNISDGPLYNNVDVNLSAFNVVNLKYDHNWMPRSFCNDFEIDTFPGYPQTQINMLSDTTTNIIGSDPGFVMPTLTPNYTESAFTADFSLLPTSTCINKGIDTAVVAGSADFAGKNRIQDTVDIGAFEFGALTTPGPSPSVAMDTIIKHCCNIIIRYPPPADPTQIKKAVQRELNIYPNPATNLLFISCPEAKGTLSLVNVTGSKITEKPVNSNLTFFDIHTMPRGIYFAVWNHDGEKTTQQIIVE